MRSLVIPAVLLLPLAMAYAGGADTIGSLPNSSAGAPGDKGAPDDSCWKDSSGNRAKVDIVGTTHGDQNVTVDDGQESGKGKGTPASDDGCRESSEIKVGDDWYQIKKGKLQKRSDPNDPNSYKDMSQVKDGECLGDNPLPY